MFKPSAVERYGCDLVIRVIPFPMGRQGRANNTLRRIGTLEETLKLVIHQFMYEPMTSSRHNVHWMQVLEESSCKQFRKRDRPIRPSFCCMDRYLRLMFYTLGRLIVNSDVKMGTQFSECWASRRFQRSEQYHDVCRSFLHCTQWWKCLLHVILIIIPGHLPKKSTSVIYYFKMYLLILEFWNSKISPVNLCKMRMRRCLCFQNEIPTFL